MNNPWENPIVEIHRLGSTDIQELKPVLQEWIRDPKTGEVLSEEIDKVLQKMQDSLEGVNSYNYFVARIDGIAIGVMGYRPPEPGMQQFVTTDNAIEGINAYILDIYRGKGIGKALALEMLKDAKEKGYKEIIFNSGPRYRETAWDRYDQMAGPSIGTARDFYGEGKHANVWRVLL